MAHVADQPTLRDYLLPAADFHAFLPDIPEASAPASTPSTAAAQFAPGLRLNRNLLPFLVTRFPNALATMSFHFQDLLQLYPAVNEPITASTKTAFDAAHLLCSHLVLGMERTMSTLALSICLSVSTAYRDLTGSEIYHYEQQSADIHTVITDRVIRTVPTPGGDGDTLLLWEDKSIYAFSTHATALQGRLNNGNFSLLDTSQITWENYEAILAKISWHAMTVDPHPKWAIVLGGRRYLIVFIAYVEDASGETRPALYCTDICSIYDPMLPITSAIIYMTLTGNIPQSQLLSRLMISVPASPGPIIIGRILPNLAATSTQVLRTAPNINIQIGGGNYDSMALTRDSENIDKKFNIYPIPALILNSSCFVGAVGTVYRCQPELVVKISFPTKFSRLQLKREASIYNHFASQLHRVKVPTFYGLFRCGLGFAIILSDDGKSLSSFRSLSMNQRKGLLIALGVIHQAGVLHGDFVPRNVVAKDNEELTIIDFSHAELNHNCPGPSACTELLEAKRLLGCTLDDITITDTATKVDVETPRPS